MKTYLFSLLFTVSLLAGTYDDAYQVVNQKDMNFTQERDSFMYGDFVEIIRFDMLHFTGDFLDNESNKTFSKIVDTIKDYDEKKEDIKVKVIGHSSKRTDDHNELVTDSNTYANAIQNWFRFSQDLNETLVKSEDYALIITRDLNNSDINESIITTEYRGDEDRAFTVGTDEGRDLSNRVMVTVYVSAPAPEVEDYDKVIDIDISEEETPKLLEQSIIVEKQLPDLLNKDTELEFLKEKNREKELSIQEMQLKIKMFELGL